MATKANTTKYDKIIFLDIDGVVNDDAYFKWLREEYKRLGNKWPEDRCMVNKEKLDLFADLCKANPGLFICLSSSWREFSYDATIERLSKYPEWENILPYIKGTTPISGFSLKTNSLRGFRGDEIKQWLDNPGIEVNRYCIVDDDLDFLEEQLQFFVHTDTDKGVTDEDMNKIKEILDLE